jgi:hypothetical protein
MSEKPPRRLPGEWVDDDGRDEPPHSGAGRLAEDDRGNVTWQWANKEVLQADDTAGAIERLRALVDPSLDVVDDGPTPHGIENPVGLKTGYNPYESGALVKTGRQKKKKKTDLRELSKWIEAKRKLEGGSSGEPEK